MKKQNKLKHKLTIWLATLGFASVCGGMAVANNYIKVERANAYKVNDTYNYVEFRAYELNNYIFTDLKNKINSAFSLNPNFLFSTYIEYNNLHYNYEEFDGEYQSYKFEETFIYFSMNNGKFTYSYYDDTQTDFVDGLFEYPVYWYSEWLVNNIQKQITISASDLNTKSYINLADDMITIDTSSYFVNNYIIYNNKQYVYESFEEEDFLQFVYNESESYISINIDNTSDTYGQIRYADTEYRPFTSSITIYSDYIVENIYAPFDGDEIVPTIATGLGLISNLALEFLNGFTALFWDTTNSVMTTFGIFAFVMLGVAITFAVVKLVLNIIRSNSGA